MDQTIHLNTIHANLSPDAFHLWATHYYKCKQDFHCPHNFSPIPYSLLCRAIELEIKARLLRQMDQKQVKTKYGHDLKKAYDDLDQSEKILTDEEIQTLKTANKLYSAKGFEYFTPELAKNMLTGFKGFPSLQKLDAIAKKLLENSPINTIPTE